MTHADWRLLVYRELQADDWYETPNTAASVLVEKEAEGQAAEFPRPLALSMNGNGYHPHETNA